MAKFRDDNRARKTLYVANYNPKFTTKQLLKELFMQGGPVVDITMLETHAYVLFQDEISVPYCLALFNDIELHGNKLRLSSRFKANNTFGYLDHLTEVRNKLRDEYMQRTPPTLPPKKFPNKKFRPIHKQEMKSNSSNSCSKQEKTHKHEGGKQRGSRGRGKNRKVKAKKSK